MPPDIKKQNKTYDPIIPLLVINTKEMESQSLRGTYYSKCITAVFKIAKTLNYPNIHVKING